MLFFFQWMSETLKLLVASRHMKLVSQFIKDLKLSLENAWKGHQSLEKTIWTKPHQINLRPRTKEVSQR